MTITTELFRNLVNGTTERANHLIKQQEIKRDRVTITKVKRPQQDIMLFVSLVQKTGGINHDKI